MSDNTGIEWADASWNPVTGCTKISPGCKHCYAERLALRLKAMGNRRYRNGFEVTLQPDQLTLPLRWRQPKLIFVNSMSDLFHEAVSEDYIRRVFDVMMRADWHVFQILTKRSERLAKLAANLPSTNSCGCMGNVSSISQVFCLRSSAHRRIARAGTRKR